MIKKDLKRMVLPLAIMLCLSISPFLGANQVDAANPPPFFSISILAPNSNPARNQWSTLMVEQLPKIGIGVDVFDHTGWAQIYPRTWDYPGPFPIPTYAEGGFDILFVGWSADFDEDPKGLWHTDSIVPNGNNHYQYSNPVMDDLIDQYQLAFDFNDRIDLAEQIQAILYDEQACQTILYPQSVFAYDPTFDTTKWDGLLWAANYQSWQNWTIPGQTEFHYACPADFVDFHIMQYESVYDAQWLSQIYAPLAERYAQLNYDYGGTLLESWTTSDFMNYTCKLKSGVKFADGAAVESDDVKFSYELITFPAFAHPDAGYYSTWITNNTVQIIDADEFVLSFNSTYVFQEGNLAIPILPKHIWETIPYDEMEAKAIEWGSTDPTKLMGAGPFYLHDYDATNGVMWLKRNTYWKDWNGAIDPYFEDIFFEIYSNKEGALSALAAGDVDMVDSQFSLQEVDIPTGMAYEIFSDPGNQEMGTNMEHPYMGTGELCPIAGADSAKYIRQAISHMIPRDIIIEEILDGLGSPGVTYWPIVSIGYDVTLDPYEYSIDLAKQKMELAGFEYPTPSPTPTDTTGIGIWVIIGILSLAGASQVFFLKRRK
jgi:ABC-type transport system substrate-binding protein